MTENQVANLMQQVISNEFVVMSLYTKNNVWCIFPDIREKVSFAQLGIIVTS